VRTRKERIMSVVAEQPAVTTFEIRKETFIAASPEIAFAAVLEEIGPGSELPDGSPFPMKLEPWPGGRWYRDRGEAGGHAFGHLWGHVQVIKAPALLELWGPMMMSSAATNHVQYKLTPEGAGTRLTLTHRAMGAISDEHRDGFHKGWDHAIGRVRNAAERKTRG
jgi:hypothetical protein